MQAQRKAGAQPFDGHPAPSATTTEPEQVSPSPNLENKFFVQFLASERFMKKFERARALLSNKNGAPSYEFVLEAALDEFLKDHDPERRKQRREERNEKAEARTESGERAAKRNVRSPSTRRICGAGWGQVDDPSVRVGQAGSGQVSGPASEQRAGELPTTSVPADGGASRHIPAATRDAVFTRDRGRCAYVGSTGKRCDATHNLEIDHIVPYARGGPNTIENLRLLCERHNKHEAERVLGAHTARRFSGRE